MTIREQFTVPKKFNTVAMALMAIGILAVIGLYITTHGGKGTEEEKHLSDARFWASLLQNSVFFLLVVNLVYAFFDTFPVIDAATGGGPVQATTTLIYKIYREGFAGLDLSASAAQSVVLMFLVIILTVVQFRYVERKVRYQ